MVFMDVLATWGREVALDLHALEVLLWSSAEMTNGVLSLAVGREVLHRSVDEDAESEDFLHP